MTPTPPDFTVLLAPGARYDLGLASPGLSAEIRVVRGPELTLPTGRLVACDPTLQGGRDAEKATFTQRPAPGRYAVELIVADMFDNGEPTAPTCAAARVCVREEPPTSWRQALLDGQDDADLDADEFYGYPVDGGLGAFASPEVLAALDNERPDDDAPIDMSGFPPERAAAITKMVADLRDGSVEPALVSGYRRILAALRAGRRFVPAGGSDDMREILDPASGFNMVTFRPGSGDGHYGTWVGYTSDNEIACFLTDFMEVTTPQARFLG